jgi:lysophospholipase L1-like esterase
VATLTLQVGDKWAAGTSVGAYPLASFPISALQKGLVGTAPTTYAAAAEAQPVGTDGKVTFTTLADGTSYLIADAAGAVYERTGVGSALGSGQWVAATAVGAAGGVAAYGDARLYPIITKRVTQPIGADGFHTSTGTFDNCNRTLVKLPVTTTRWRLRVCNRNALLDTAYSGGNPTFTGAWVGDPSFVGATGNRWVGVFSSAPSQVLGSSALNNDGTDFATPWVTDAGSQFAAYRLYGLSYGHTLPSSATYVWDNVGVCFTGSGAAAHAGDTGAPNGLSVTAVSVWDTRLEYEFTTSDGPGGIKTMVALGDSICRGYIQSGSSIFQHEAWPNQAGLRDGIAVANIGVSGVQASDFAGGTGTEWRWTRADLVTTPPDIAVVLLGFNDVTNGTTAVTIEGYLMTVMDRLRALNSNMRIYLGTITPGNNTNELIRTAANAWIGTVPYGADGCFDFNKQIGLQATPQTTDTALTNGFPHPNQRGYARMADVCRFGRHV